MPKQALDFETMSDVELAEHASRHDGLAIRTIMARNNQRLFRAAWSVVRNHSDAEEIVQEAYMKAFNAMERYQGASSLSTWLTRIVINKSIDRQRRTTRRNTALQDQGITLLQTYGLPGSGQPATSPEAELARKEVSHRLKEAVARLSEDYRTVFVLREIEDMSLREISNILDIKEATVKTRLHRARRLLREDLELEFRAIVTDTITFAGSNCEKMTTLVLRSLNIPT